jgi:hypothetical protein
MSKLYLNRDELTARVYKLLNLSYPLQRCRSLWWVNKRSGGGLHLTSAGDSAFMEAGLAHWDFDCSGLDVDSNSNRLLLDRCFPCPYHLLTIGRRPRQYMLRIWDGRIASLVTLHGGVVKYMGSILPDHTKLVLLD